MMQPTLVPNRDQVDAFGAMRFGFPAVRAAAALPQTTQAPLFTVVGGRVAAFLLGEVVTAIQNQVNNTKLVHNPTAGTDVDLSAVLNIANKEAGTFFGITGTPADAMLGAGQGVRFVSAVILKPGTIDLSCAASNTGTVKWTCFYVPIDLWCDLGNGNRGDAFVEAA